MKVVSCVIPVYNEEYSFPGLIEALDQYLPSGYRYEYLFVDDGSTDSTFSKITEMGRENSRIRIISFTRNFGHQAAIFAGLQNASGDAVITMDADFQDPPELLPQFIKKWEEGTPIVLGRRINRKRDTFFKKISAELYYFLLSLISGVEVPKNVGDYRLLDRKVVEVVSKMPRKSTYLRGLIAWTGYNYIFVDYDRPKRYSGKSKYSYSKMFRLALEGFFNLSSFPMRLGMVMGLLSIITGLFFLGYITYDAWFNNEDYPLYKWLVVILFIFTGFLFILIWILSEYVGRLYREFQDNPIYIVNKEVNSRQTRKH